MSLLDAIGSYAPRYKMEFSDVYQDTKSQYIATIYKFGYLGAVSEISGSSDPITIQTNREGESSYRSVISTLATVNVQLKESDDFDIFDFINSDPESLLLEITVKNGASYDIKWRGYYINSTDFSLSEIYPINISLQFSDFALLKAKRFYDFVDADTDKKVKFNTNDTASLLEILLKACYLNGTTSLANINFNSDLTNIYTKSSGTESYPLGLNSIYVQKNAFLSEIGRYQTMYDVLDGICSQYELVCFYKDNKFYVVSYDAWLNSNSRTVSRYDILSFTPFTDTITYTQLGDITETDTVVAVNSSDFKNLSRSQNIYFTLPKRNFVYDNTNSTNVNLPNYNFNAPVFQKFTSVAQGGGAFRNTWFYSIARWYDNALKEYMYQYQELSSGGPLPIYPFIRPFYPYSNINTASPTNFKFETRFKVRDTLTYTDYLQSQPLDVNPSDYVAIGFSALTDGRLKSAPNVANYRPTTRLAITLDATDENGVEARFFYNKLNGKFVYTGASDISAATVNVTNYLIEPTLTTNFDGDSDRLSYFLRASLDIPSNGKIRIRMYAPYRTQSGVSQASDEYALYVQYLNMQTFKGHSDSVLPKNQKFTIYYQGVAATDNDITNKTGVFNFDGTQYNLASLPSTANPNRVTPFLPSSYLGNQVQDIYGNPASGITYKFNDLDYNLIDYTNLKTSLTSAGRYVLRNNGLLATRIQGQFKSNPNFTIGQKFSYAILNQPSKNYIMLDYNISLKNSSFDATLYSMNYTDDSAKTVLTITTLS